MRNKKSCVRVHGSRTTAVVLSLLASTAVARAQNATWIGTAGPPNNWNTAANWSPVPSGPPAYVPTGTAFFNSSLTTTIEIASGTTVGGLTFTGAPAYTFTLPGTFIINGAGVVADSSSATPTFDVNSGGNLVLVNSATAGPSNVNIVSGGSMTLVNTSSAGSGIITNAGSVNFNDGSNGGTASIFNNAGAFINFNQGGGLLSASAGNATIDNSGTMLFWNSSTAGNATIITRSGGNTIFLNQSSAGASQQTVMAGGALTFQNGSNAGTSTITNYSTALNFNDTSSAGSAHIINNAGAQLLFNLAGGSASASNATIDNFGTLGFFNSSSASNATITTYAGGLTQFNGAATGDTARIIINSTGAGFGTVNISSVTAANFTIGSLAGTGSNAQLQIGGKTLIVGGDNRSTTYQGFIFDGGAGGSLTKVGTGTLTLSGTTSFTGTTTISNGGLHVAGEMNGMASLLVGPAGTLSGTGSITAGTVTVNGTLAPGPASGADSIMVITTPSLTLGPTAIYRASLLNGPSGIANFVIVNGSATLGGTLQIRIGSAGVNFNTAYQIFGAGTGLSQQFAAVNVTGPYSTTLTYNSSNVLATFSPNLTGYAAGGNANQRAAAAAIQAGLIGASSPGGFTPLFSLDQTSYLAALSQLSGETATASAPTGFKAMDSFMNVVLNPFIDQRLSGFGPGAPIPYAQEEVALADSSLAYVQKKKIRPAAEEAFASLRQPQATTRDGRFNSWVSGYGAWAKTNGDASSSAVDTRLGGVVGGIDYRPAPGLVFGVAAGGALTNTSLDSGSADTTVAQVGVYSAVRIDKAYLSAAFAYGWHSADTSRTVSIAGSDRITGAFDAYSLNGRVETGMRYGLREFGITPFAAVQAQRFHTPSYQEKAGGTAAAFAISYSANDTNALRSELGVWFDAMPRATSGPPVNLRARVAWAHNFGDAPTATGAFATFPSGTFVVTGVKPAADALLATAAAEWAVRPGTWLTARFDTEQSRSSSAYSGMGGIRFTW